MELEADGFSRRVAEGYRCLAEQQDVPWLVVDGRGTVDEVADLVWAGVEARVGRPS
jgi:thymidylate kinase